MIVCCRESVKAEEGFAAAMISQPGTRMRVRLTRMKRPLPSASFSFSIPP